MIKSVQFFTPSSGNAPGLLMQRSPEQRVQQNEIHRGRQPGMHLNGTLGDGMRLLLRKHDLGSAASLEAAGPSSSP